MTYKPDADTIQRLALTMRCGAAWLADQLREFNWGPGVQVTPTAPTLRDQFAMHALQGICAAGPDAEWTDVRIAGEAWRLADAMMVQRGHQ